VNRDELDSQVSAMFDGELPAAECELLSRRLMREESLRATWSRYAVIGAALRAEPLARVNPDFARRVSAGLAGASAVAVRVSRPWRSAALGVGLAASVAGAAIMLLRSGLPVDDEALTAYSPTVERAAAPRGPSLQSVTVTALAGERLAFLPASREPASYVVPPRSVGNTPVMSASLANYALAHSAVSSPLARGSLLSTLIGNESVAPVDVVEATPPDAQP
jgi:sigma-E factor negative regulatory protein RseA